MRLLCVRSGLVYLTAILSNFRSFGFSTECLGQHSGDAQAADLGDGDNYSKLFFVMAINSRSVQTVLPIFCFQRTRLLS